MYVGLFIRDECERSVKDQGSKDESMEFATSSQEETRENAMCEADDWKLKSHTRLWSSRMFHGKGHPAKYPWNFLFGKKFICFTKFFIRTICILITHELWEVLSERKP